jgi:hypothetical protein
LAQTTAEVQNFLGCVSTVWAGCVTRNIGLKGLESEEKGEYGVLLPSTCVEGKESPESCVVCTAPEKETVPAELLSHGRMMAVDETPRPHEISYCTAVCNE